MNTQLPQGMSMDSSSIVTQMVAIGGLLLGNFLPEELNAARPLLGYLIGGIIGSILSMLILKIKGNITRYLPAWMLTRDPTTITVSTNDALYAAIRKYLSLDHRNAGAREVFSKGHDIETQLNLIGTTSRRNATLIDVSVTFGADNPQQLSISTPQTYDALLDAIKQIWIEFGTKNERSITYETFMNKRGWAVRSILTGRSVTNTVITGSIRQFLDAVQTFIEQKDRYNEIGAPYRTGFLLYGVPGTGKTTAVKLIAAHYDIRIFDIRLESFIRRQQVTGGAVAAAPTVDPFMIPAADNPIVEQQMQRRQSGGSTTSGGPQSDNSLYIDEQALSTALEDIGQRVTRGKPYIVLLEEFDSLTAIKAGAHIHTFKTFMDGIVEASGQIVVATSNHPEYITQHEALMRSGRLNAMIEFHPYTVADVMRAIQIAFPEFEYTSSDVECYKLCNKVTGANVVSKIMEFETLEDAIAFYLERKQE